LTVDKNIENQSESLLRAAKAVFSYNTFEEAARAIFDEARLLTGAQSGYVALLSDDGDENELVFLEAGGIPCSVNPELPMPVRGLRETAYRSGEVVFDNDFMQSEWADLMPSGHVELANVMFSPLNINGKTVGIMGLANKPRPFTPLDASIAGTFGEFAAVALTNCRMKKTTP
jgi:GAF domain-containing protein